MSVPTYAKPLPVITPVLGKPIDPANRTAAHRLFNDRYRVMMSQMDLYSEKYLREGGMVTTGDKEVDRAMAYQKVQCYQTAAGMAELLDQGCSFHLVDPNDSVKIYRDVIDHLTDWKHYVTREINPINVPKEDLAKFDHLASEIYYIARGFMAMERQPEGFFTKLEAMERRRGIAKNRPEVDSSGVPIQSSSVAERHTPIADSIRQMVSFGPGSPKRK